MLNFSEEAVIELIATLPLLISILLLYKEYRKFNDKTILYLIATWLSLDIFMCMDAISYIVKSMFLFRGKTIFIAMMVIFVTILVDKMRAEIISPYTFSIAVLIAVFNIGTAFVDEYFIETTVAGYFSFGVQGKARDANTIAMLWTLLLLSYYHIRIYRNAPKELQKSAIIALIGK